VNTIKNYIMERTKVIESYLDGSMNQSEQENFEKLIREDTELASQVALSKDINDAILDEGTVHFRKLVRSVIDANTDRYRKVIRTLKIPLAASILLLIGLSFWHILSYKSPAEIYETYYKPYEIDLYTRSANSSSEKSEEAYKMYQGGNYKGSFEILQNYLTENNSNLTAHFYCGLDAIELGIFNIATEELIPVEQNIVSPFSLHARWYLALTYLRLNQPEDARRYLLILVSNDNMYSENAKSILKKLKF
jgi:hypothetical protein